MAVEFDFVSLDDIAIGIPTGSMTLDEIKEAVRTLWKQTDAPEILSLWDLRRATFDLGADEVRELAEFVKEAAPVSSLRTAFLVARDLEFGLIRMFAVFRETEGARAAVFRDRDEAIAWLCSRAE